MSNELFCCTLSVRLKPDALQNDDRPLPRWWGRAVQAWFLSVVRDADPVLAEELHAENRLHPYTVSSLIGLKKDEPFNSEKPLQLRLSSLNPSLSEILIRALKPGGVFDIGKECMIDYLPFVIEKPEKSRAPIPSPSSVSFADLIGRGLQMAENGVFDLRFVSPTLFSSEGKTQPVPLPGLVFHSLTDRWNAFSPITFPEELVRYSQECLAISGFQVESVPVQLKEDALRIGAVGRMRYRALNHDRYWVSMLHALAQIAPFSGVGSGTGFGLGQCRIPEKKKVS